MAIRECALQNPAFAELKHVFDNRDEKAAAFRAKGGKVIAELGVDVPDEMIIGAGMMPVRVYADPEKALTETDKYLEFSFDPQVRAQFERLVDGTYGSQVDALAISNSTDVIIRVFLYLRELHRVEPEKNVPEVEFIDWLFSRHRLHQQRDEFVIDLFRKAVERWSGKELTDEMIREGGRICNENRAALRRIGALRHGEEVRISGSEALVIIGSAFYMDRAEHTALVNQVADAAAEWPVIDAPKVFFTGSQQEDTWLYDQIEAQGLVGAGEDTDAGDRFYDRDFNMDYPVIRAVVDRYLYREYSAKKATVQERAGALDREVEAVGADGVIFYTNQYDEVATWDMPKQRKNLEARGIKHMTFGKMQWPAWKNEDTVEKLAAFAEELKNAKGGTQ